jgi:hypothetical protein
MKRLFVLLVVVLGGTAVFGQSHQLLTAKELQMSCNTAEKVFEAHGKASTDDAKEYGTCTGYIEGVLDSMRVLGLSDHPKPGLPHIW